jgi:flagellar biosynthesis/type III secretory pathway protein FliH
VIRYGRKEKSSKKGHQEGCQEGYQEGCKEEEVTLPISPRSLIA